MSIQCSWMRVSETETVRMYGERAREMAQLAKAQAHN